MYNNVLFTIPTSEFTFYDIVISVYIKVDVCIYFPYGYQNSWNDFNNIPYIIQITLWLMDFSDRINIFESLTISIYPYKDDVEDNIESSYDVAQGLVEPTILSMFILL